MEQERRSTTVLFADIHGFTALAEQLDPEQVAEALELCLSTIAAVIEKHGGHVDKILGDGIMALFGAPTASSDHAAEAVGAGLALQRAMEELRPELVRRVGRRLRLQVGISSGTVIAGPMGPPDRRTYTVVGDAVNVASRLQEEASPGTVLVSAATYRLVASAFRWGRARALHLKGKRRSVLAYRVLGPQPHAHATPERTTPAFVGRSAELAALRETWRRACQGTLQFVTLTGESGAGKSRLAGEFAASLEGEPQAQVVWADLADGALRLRDDCAGTRASVGTEDGGRGTDPDHDAPPLGAVSDILAARCQRASTLLIIEEPRVPSDAAIRRLAPLLRKLRRRPLMVLALGSRSLFVRPWGIPRTSLHLDRLPERHAAQLLEAVLNGAASKPVRRLVVGRARGLPLYIVEIGRWLLETEAVERRSGQWTFRGGGPGPSELPDSLQSAVQLRIDRLEEPAKELLRHAAVLGEVFSPDLLAAVAGLTKPPDRQLRRLEEAQLLCSVRGPGRRRRYTFTHPMIRETIYQTMLRSTAATIHRRAAEALQDLPSEYPENVPEAVAHHYRRAGDDDQAARYYLLAAERADRWHAPQEAQQLRKAASQLLGFASVWFLYGGGARPPLRRRFLSAAAQFIFAVALVTPIFAFGISQRPPPDQVTLALPSQVMSLSPSTMVLPVILGGIPFLATGLLLAHLAAPNYLRARPSLRLQSGLVLGGWLLALLAVALTLAVLGLALRFNLLPRALSHFSGVAIFRLLAADVRFIAGILGATLVMSLTCNGWLRWEATWRRRQVLATTTERRDATWMHPGRVAQQLGLVVVVTALLSAFILFLYLVGVLPSVQGRPSAGGASLAAVASALGILALAGLALRGWTSRLALGAPARRMTLGLEVPLIIALLLGAFSAFAVRQEVVAVSKGLFGPGDMGALNRTAALFPNLGAVAYIRGELHWFQGNESQALADFTRAIELEPSFPAAYAGRAAILARQGAYQEAERDATRVVELRPEHPAGYAIRTTARLALGKIDRAAADLQLATRPLPETTQGWDAYFMRCVALGESGRLPEAIADCRRSLELNDRHVGTYEILGRYYYQAGLYRPALDAFERMLQLVPGDALALANRGAAQRALGQYERALEDLNRSLIIEPRLDTAYRERALTWLALDLPGEAMADAEQAVSINSALAMNHYVLGYVATYAGEYERVIASMDRALSLQPDASFYNMRGYAFALQGDHRRALDDLRRALLLNPSSAHAYDSRGFTLLRAGRFEEALTDLNRALALLPASDTSSRAEFLYHQALVLAALGQDEAAISALQEASSFTALPTVRRQIDGALQLISSSQ